MPKASQAIVPVGEWWLELARDLITKEMKRRSLTRLGEDLARRIPGKRRFDHGQLSKFKDAKVGATFELMIALCEEFESLPQPIFVPRTQAEAIALFEIARDYDPPKSEATDEPEEMSLAEILTFPSRHHRKRPPLAPSNANERQRRRARG